MAQSHVMYDILLDT